MCNDCERKSNQQNSNEQQCPKCSTFYNAKDGECQRCRHIANYIEYLERNGSLI